MPLDPRVQRMLDARRANAEKRRAARAVPHGARVQMLPHTDWFMRGARYGTTRGAHSTWVRVQLDMKPEGDIVYVSPDSVEVIDG